MEGVHPRLPRSLGRAVCKAAPGTGANTPGAHLLGRTPVVAFCAIAALAGQLSCGPQGQVKSVTIESKEPSVAARSQSNGPALRVAVGGKITPKEGLAYYRQLLDYIGEKMGRPVKFIAKDNSGEVNDLLRDRGIDVAFVCSGPYVQGHDAFGMELLVAPRAYGSASHHSYIIVPVASRARSLAELRGKDFAFADPQSNTGKLVPTYVLARMGTTPEAFFGKYIYTYSHDNSIKAVARRLVDGAAVDSLIWEYQNATNPVFTSKTRIVFKSPSYAIPPVVVHPAMAASLKRQLRAVFLGVHRDSEGRRILKKMMIDRFVLIDDAAYNSIRAMNRWVARQKHAKP